MQQLTKAQVQQIARRLAKRYGEKYIAIPYEEQMTSRGYDYYGPWVFPGSHEESNANWVISWEMCPEYEWTYSDDVDKIAREVAPGFYAEPINHICMAFFPA